MSPTKLKIAVSACYFHADPTRPVFKGKTLLYCEQSLAHWILSEGAYLYMIPSVPADNTPNLAELTADFDGLVLEGGSDVSAATFGETPLRPEWIGDAVRDLYEIELLRIFMSRKKPVLGICRGLQLINVALGGSLYQDIQTQVPKASEHRNWEIYDQNFHVIRFTEGSRLAQLYPGFGRGRVNSVHHQAIKGLARDLVVEARADGDEIIEAVRYRGDSFVHAVQWHPEFHDPRDPSLLDSKPLLHEFLAAANRGKSS